MHLVSKYNFKYNVLPISIKFKTTSYIIDQLGCIQTQMVVYYVYNSCNNCIRKCMQFSLRSAMAVKKLGCK